MLIEYVVLLVVFIVLSVLSFMGKLTAFIAGETKENTEARYNERSAGNFIGIVMSVLVLSTAVGILGFFISDASWLILAAPITFILVLVFAIIFINTNNRFVEGDVEEEEK